MVPHHRAVQAALGESHIARFMGRPSKPIPCRELRQKPPYERNLECPPAQKLYAVLADAPIATVSLRPRRDSELEAFSHYPSEVSFTLLVVQSDALTRLVSEPLFLSY